MTRMIKNDKNLKSRVALISVYNKEGIVEFARGITDLGFKILASGGTAKVLLEAGLEVTDVASLVGGGAILGHRVVTLSREVHAGLLARDVMEDREELEKLKIPFIDLVCVDLYPLQQQISESANQLISKAEARNAILEKTDIGGPTMLRSAAKGRRIVVAEANDREKVIEWLKKGEPDREEFISSLCAKAEYIVADYCLASARYHSAGKLDGVIGKELLECKYGENAWQTPAGLFGFLGNGFKPFPTGDELSLVNFKLLAGSSPSYNNWCDVDRMLQTITHIGGGFDVNFSKASPPQGGGKQHIAVGVKHGNSCGAGVSDNSVDSIKKMLEGDLRAIFGGLVMVNFEIDEELAEVLLSHRMTPTTSPLGSTRGTPPQAGGDKQSRRLLDGIIAPSFSGGAIEMMKRKGDKCRFLINSALSDLSKNSLDNHSRFRYVRGGFLKQPNYNFVLELPPSPSHSASSGHAFEKRGGEVLGELSESQKSDIIFAWAIGSTSNSNTVTIVKDGMLLGNGVGQQDRVGGCELAIKRAQDSHHNLNNAVAYSDSFFPFPDGPLTLIKAGIKTIFATSGSVKDEEIKKVCVDNQVTLVLLPDSEARGFFGH